MTGSSTGRVIGQIPLTRPRVVCETRQTASRDVLELGRTGRCNYGTVMGMGSEYGEL
jgi:hypothetical protein